VCVRFDKSATRPPIPISLLPVMLFLMSVALSCSSLFCLLKRIYMCVCVCVCVCMCKDDTETCICLEKKIGNKEKGGAERGN